MLVCLDMKVEAGEKVVSLVYNLEYNYQALADGYKGRQWLMF